MFYLLVAAGFGLLLFGGECLVRGAVSLARRLGVSPLLIGLTIVAYGTSAPELLVSLEAHLTGAPGIAVGNVVGSNIANILLILGCTALIFPVTCAPGALKDNGLVLLSASVVLVLLGLAGAVNPWASVLMLALLIAFSVLSYRTERQGQVRGNPEAVLHVKEAEEYQDGPKTLPYGLLALLAGLVGVIVGSHFLVTGAVGLARDIGVSDAVIGLTLVAVGTSLPELATAVVAAYRRHSDVALGNVLGSNIFNILGIMGVVPLFGSLPIPPQVAAFDLWIMLAVTFFFVLWTSLRNSIGRPLAVVFLVAYAVYVASQYLGISALPAPQV
ncbi:MAG: calcium/sodium antiporter [Kiloniellaceae bacterium]